MRTKIDRLLNSGFIVIRGTVNGTLSVERNPFDHIKLRRIPYFAPIDGLVLGGGNFFNEAYQRWEDVFRRADLRSTKILNLFNPPDRVLSLVIALLSLPPNTVRDTKPCPSPVVRFLPGFDYGNSAETTPWSLTSRSPIRAVDTFIVWGPVNPKLSWFGHHWFPHPSARCRRLVLNMTYYSYLCNFDTSFHGAWNLNRHLAEMVWIFRYGRGEHPNGQDVVDITNIAATIARELVHGSGKVTVVGLEAMHWKVDCADVWASRFYADYTAVWRSAGHQETLPPLEVLSLDEYRSRIGPEQAANEGVAA
jgi:hypothetical protein